MFRKSNKILYGITLVRRVGLEIVGASPNEGSSYFWGILKHSMASVDN